MSESNNHKIAEININGEKYKVSVYLSVNDTISVLDYCKDNDYDIDNDLCRAVISKIISNHIIENQSMITIEEIKEDTFAIGTYVNLLINENVDLNAAYNKLQDEENICLRFVKAVYDMSQNMTANVMHSIGDSIKSIQAVLPPIKDIAYNMQSILKPIFDFTNQIGEMIANISNTFNSFFEGIQFPTISDERKKELGEIYALWGEYGWTMIPDLEFCYLEDSPATQKYANKLALNYCDAETITNLFNITKTLNGVKAKDYEEAVFNFKNKKYKSCAMILLSLIDAKLIRMQRKEDRNKGRRSTGFSAIKNIEKRIDAEENIEKKLLLFLLYKNLFACLKEIFANGDDFKTQPILANRNFVYHGMLHRSVYKRDCIQLFLLYYNFLMFFEMIVD